MLPLGLRVQEKLERLIDKYMRSVGEKNPSIAIYLRSLTGQRCLQGFVVFSIRPRALGAVRPIEGGFRGDYLTFTNWSHC